MPYRLSAGASASSEIRRVLREESASVLEQVSDPSPRSPDEAIHEARKSIKKLRGLLRLLSPRLSRTLHKRETRHLRHIGRQLSDLRDAQAVIEAFDQVSADFHISPVVRQAARGCLLANKKEVEARVDRQTVFQEIVPAIIEFRKRLSKMRLSPNGFGLLEPGLQCTYKQGRKARAQAKKHPTADAFHQWRKRVKDHWYHARLLSEVANPDWSRRLDRLEVLEGLLGDDHNLAVLSEFFAEDRQFASISHKLHEISLQLRAEALSVGKELYANKWSAVADELTDGHMLWPAKIGKPARRKSAPHLVSEPESAARPKPLKSKPPRSAHRNKKGDAAIA